jgi:hypothetical protein
MNLMNLDWLADGRKIPDEVMYYIRVMAVNSIRVLGQSPEVIAKAYNFREPLKIPLPPVHLR